MLLQIIDTIHRAALRKLKRRAPGTSLLPPEKINPSWWLKRPNYDVGKANLDTKLQRETRALNTPRRTEKLRLALAPRTDQRDGTEQRVPTRSRTQQTQKWQRPGNKDGALARTTQTSHRRQICSQNTTRAHKHRRSYNNHTATFATPHAPKENQPCRLT
ncbi:hypothetical protein Bca4012_033162 [Brassica carinata]